MIDDKELLSPAKINKTMQQILVIDQESKHINLEQNLQLENKESNQSAQNPYKISERKSILLNLTPQNLEKINQQKNDERNRLV